MRNLLLTIQYDGTHFHGWQIQKNALSVQAVFQRALERVLDVRPDIKGCSRTDTGVHARCFGISLQTDSVIAERDLIKALNVNLPKTIAVTACEEKDMAFHARYCAKGKEYVYQILTSELRDPFLTGYALHYPYGLDVPTLHREGQDFVGRHDFSAFCSSGSNITDPVREVFSFSVTQKEKLALITVSADGFLYNMVRIMVGTLLKIQQGKILPGSIPGIIENGDRSKAGHTAPAHGLFLNRVFY